MASQTHAQPSAEQDRRALRRALRLAAIENVAGQRAYLVETGSAYAAGADNEMVRAAFSGALQFALEDLARAYQAEVDRTAELAAQQAVAHAKLYDYEAQLNA